jgi:hypothetical protein
MPGNHPIEIDRPRAVSVYVLSGGTWNFETRVFYGFGLNELGVSVAVKGDTLVAKQRVSRAASYVRVSRGVSPHVSLAVTIRLVAPSRNEDSHSRTSSVRTRRVSPGSRSRTARSAAR